LIQAYEKLGKYVPCSPQAVVSCNCAEWHNIFELYCFARYSWRFQMWNLNFLFHFITIVSLIIIGTIHNAHQIRSYMALVPVVMVSYERSIFHRITKNIYSSQ